MTSESRQSAGRVYVLRVWAARREDNGRSPPARYILEDPFSKARRGFANLAALTAYLQELSVRPNVGPE